MIKVLQLIDSLDVGGAEVLSVNIANELATVNNVTSFLCTTRKEGKLKNKISKEVSYLFLNKRKRIDVKAILKLVKYIKQHKIAIIHAHSTSIFTASLVKVLYPKVKIVWHDHYGKDLSKRNNRFLKLISNKVDFVISVNSNLKNWTEKNLNIERVSQLNNFPKFNQEKQTELKGIDGKRIVLVAGFRPQKDHLNLLKAFSLILETEKEWTLHLIGKDYNDVYSEKTHKYIQINGLKKSVFFYGVCSDIKHILDQSTIGVLSSKSEGLPVSLLEYGLAKLPVLVTNVGDCAKVVQNQKGLVKPNDNILFANKLLKLITSEEDRQEIALELNNNVVTRYSKEVFINKLLEIYNSI